MEFTAQLDLDVVALEAEDDVTCLISLTAPVPEGLAERPGETLIAVVDRSGSMYGVPIHLAHCCGWRSGSRVDPTYSAP